MPSSAFPCRYSSLNETNLSSESGNDSRELSESASDWSFVSLPSQVGMVLIWFYQRYSVSNSRKDAITSGISLRLLLPRYRCINCVIDDSVRGKSWMSLY